MKNYNKLPFKERKRHWQYPEKHEELLLKREMKRLEKEKLSFNREQECISDKEREAAEANEILKRMIELERMEGHK